MNLSQAEKLSLQVMCGECGARQPGYILRLIDEHGEDADVGEAIKNASCMWCSRMGKFRVSPLLA